MPGVKLVYEREETFLDPSDEASWLEIAARSPELGQDQAKRGIIPANQQRWPSCRHHPMQGCNPALYDAIET